MKRYPFLFFVLILTVVSLACGSQIITPTPTPTPVSAIGIGLTMVSDQVNAKATQAKLDSILAVTAQVVAATATQQAQFVQATQIQQQRIDAQATAQKADAIAQATNQQARQDAAATAEQKRADAQATQQRLDFDSTQQAISVQATQQRLDLEATQAQARLDLAATQQAAGTAQAWSVTQQVIPTHDYWTQQAVQQEMLIATNQVELSNLEVKKQSHTNDIQWILFDLAAILIVGAIVLFLRSRAQVHTIKDQDGDPQVVIFQNQKALFPGLMPKALIELKTGNTPDLTNPEEQADIVKRAQGIKALQVMPVNPAMNGADAYNQLFGGMFSEGNEKELPVIEWARPDQIGDGVMEHLEGQVLEEG